MTDVFVDWGTTQLRAFRVDANGAVVARYSAAEGFKAVAESGAFELALDRALLGLQAKAHTPVLLAGMVGARGGLCEVPYCTAPVRLSDLAAACASVPGRAGASIVPGVASGFEVGLPEVMRGEELQVFGVLTELPDSRRIVLPGTHSKWVGVENGAIVSIETHMTGELFELASLHSILARQITPHFRDAAFQKGLDLAKSGLPLSRALFQIRTALLFDRIEVDDSRAMLSGLLLGIEVRDASTAGARDELVLCGALELCQSYLLACARFGRKASIVDVETATVAGFRALREYLP
jgi:2-dehydro-3-deoxygalactonokinase